MIGATAVLVARHDGSSPHVAVPGAGVSARVVTGNGAVDARSGVCARHGRWCSTPRPGAARAPFYGRQRDGVGGERRPRRQRDATLAHVVRDRRLARGRRRPTSRRRSMSIAEGEGARWALTRNPRATEGSLPDTFLKRIGPVGDPASTSCRSTPTRWVRSRRSVARCGCRCATASCSSTPPMVTSCGAIALPAAAHRWVAQVGQGRVRDRRRRAPPARPRLGARAIASTSAPRSSGSRRAGVDGRVLLRNEQGGTDRARVAGAIVGRPGARRHRRCPPGSTPTASNRRQRGCGRPVPSTAHPRSCCSTTPACTRPSCSTTRRRRRWSGPRRTPSPRWPNGELFTSSPCPEATADVPRASTWRRHRTSTPSREMRHAEADR